MKCSFLAYVQLLMISRVIRATKVDRNAKKAPNSSKMKCLFLDYVQLLMIGWAIRVTKVNQNAKKRPPKSLKNQMLVFGLCSTSDDQPSDLSNKG